MRLTKLISRASLSLTLAFGVLGLVHAVVASATDNLSGRAHLIGPKPCPQRAFHARVRGARIERVLFVLDGRSLETLTRTNFRGTYALRIDPRRLRLGIHRLVATVTFQRGGAAEAQTFRLGFQRCPRALRTPRFTG